MFFQHSSAKDSSRRALAMREYQRRNSCRIPEAPGQGRTREGQGQPPLALALPPVAGCPPPVAGCPPVADLAQACGSANAAANRALHLLRANRPHHPRDAVRTRPKASHRPANQHKVIDFVRRPISPLAVRRAIPCSLAHAVPSANHPATAAAQLDQHLAKLRLVVAHIGERSLEGVCAAGGLEAMATMVSREMMMMLMMVTMMMMMVMMKI